MGPSIAETSAVLFLDSLWTSLSIEIPPFNTYSFKDHSNYLRCRINIIYLMLYYFSFYVVVLKIEMYLINNKSCSLSNYEK